MIKKSLGALMLTLLFIAFNVVAAEQLGALFVFKAYGFGLLVSILYWSFIYFITTNR